jgi:hypothetical protein
MMIRRRALRDNHKGLPLRIDRDDRIAHDGLSLIFIVSGRPSWAPALNTSIFASKSPDALISMALRRERIHRSAHYSMTIIAIIDRVVLRRTDEEHRAHVIGMRPT